MRRIFAPPGISAILWPLPLPPGRIERYRGRISGPLLDRIDLRIEVPALEPRELAAIVHVAEAMQLKRALDDVS